MTLNRKAIRAALILKEREQNDPVKNFMPSRDQLRLYSSKALRRLARGANRCGKTALNQIDCVATFRGIHPYRANYKGGRGAILIPRREVALGLWHRRFLEQSELYSPSGDMSKQPLIPEHEIGEIYFDKSTKPWVLKRITHKYTEKEFIFYWSAAGRAKLAFEGMSFDHAWIDEKAGGPDVIDELEARLTDARSQPDRRPDGGGIFWGSSEDDWNERLDEWVLRVEDEKSDPRYWFGCKLSSHDNPAVTDEGRAISADGMSSDMADIKMRGTNSLGGVHRVFPKFTKERHCVLSRRLEDSDNLWVGYDPGVAHPGGITVGVCSREDPSVLRIVKYIHSVKQTLRWEAGQLATFLLGRRPAWFIYDPATNKLEKTSGTTVLMQMLDLFRDMSIKPMNIRRAYHRHIPGIATVISMLDPDQRNPDCPPRLVYEQPTAENNLTIWAQQMAGYKGRPAQRFTGQGGVIKVNDEAPDTTRYISHIFSGYNELWSCGPNLSGYSVPFVAFESVAEQISQEELEKREREKRSREIYERSRGRNRNTRPFS